MAPHTVTLLGDTGYSHYKFLLTIQPNGDELARLYRRTVASLRRSFHFGASKCQVEIGLIIDDVALLTTRIYDLEHKLMLTSKSDMAQERLLISMKSARMKFIDQLQNLRAGKNVEMSNHGKQAYRGTMVRSKILKQEMGIENSINEDKSRGTVTEETQLGSKAGSDI